MMAINSGVSGIVSYLIAPTINSIVYSTTHTAWMVSPNPEYGVNDILILSSQVLYYQNNVNADWTVNLNTADGATITTIGSHPNLVSATPSVWKSSVQTHNVTVASTVPGLAMGLTENAGTAGCYFGLSIRYRTL